MASGENTNRIVSWREGNIWNRVGESSSGSGPKGFAPPSFVEVQRTSDRNYDFFGGTAQPPLPLQEFFPEQPLSPVLQPPCPLQEFFPAQSCLAAFFFFAVVVVSCPNNAEPATKPAVAVPRAMVNFLRFI